MIMELYRNIDRTKVQFDFIVDKKNEMFFADEIEKLGGKIYIMNSYKLYNHFLYCYKLKRFFKEHPEYEIIHCHLKSIASIVLRIAKKFGLLTICHSHSTTNGTGAKAIIKSLLQKKIINYSDYLFACSENSAKWVYGEEVLKSDKCFIINNAIDSTKYIYNSEIRKRIRHELHIDNSIVIGQVGRIDNVKNHIYSLNILKKCLELDENYILMIVGDGILYNLIQNKIVDMQLENNVIMLGNRSDVNDLMQAMDVFIMPSLSEGLPLALIEAQAASLPCIISNKISAGILDIQNVSIHDIDAENYEDWVKAISHSLKHKRIDNSKLIESNNFDIKHNATWIENFYFEIIKNKN